MSANQHFLNWSSTYWVMLANQLIIMPILVLLATALVGESYRACHAAELDFPRITRWYFVTIGPSGLVWSGVLSVAIALATVGIRLQNAFIHVPCQIVRGARRIVYRLLAWNPWQPVFFRLAQRLKNPLRC